MADIRLVKRDGADNARHVEATDTVRFSALGLGLAAPAAGNLQVSGKLLIGATADHLPTVGVVGFTNSSTGNYIYSTQRLTPWGDIRVVGVSSSNHVILGSTANQADTYLDCPVAQSIYGYVGTINRLQVSATGITVVGLSAVDTAFTQGAGPADSGAVRLSASTAINAKRTSAGNVCLMSANGDDAYVGYSTAGALAPTTLWCNAATQIDFRIAAGQKASLTTSLFSILNSLAIGPAPVSATGRIRLATSGEIMRRNSGDTGDLNVLAWDDAGITVGSATSLDVVTMVSAAEAYIKIGSATVIKAESGITTLEAPILRFGNTVVSPSIIQRDDTTTAVTADDLTIRAQSATGTGATVGGTLVLGGGSGATGGNVNLLAALGNGGPNGYIVMQSGNDRTLALNDALSFPMVHGQRNSNSTSYVSLTSTAATIIELDPREWPPGRRVVKFRAIVHSEAASIAYAVLYNVTDSNIVWSSQVYVNSTGWILLEATCTIGTNEIENSSKLYDTRIMSNSTDYQAYIAWSEIRVRYE